MPEQPKRVKFDRGDMDTWPDWWSPEVEHDNPGKPLPGWLDDPRPDWAPVPEGLTPDGDGEPVSGAGEAGEAADPEYIYEKRDKDKRNKRMAKYMREVYRPRLAREIEAGRRVLRKKGDGSVH